MNPSSGSTSDDVIPASQLAVSVMPYAFTTSRVPVQPWIERHSEADNGAEPQNTRLSVRRSGGLAIFKARRQTVGTEERHVILWWSMTSPRLTRRSARNGGRMYK